MRNSYKKRYTPKHMDPKAKMRELMDKVMSSTVSVALVASLVPAAGIAYAVENNGSNVEVQEAVENENSSSTNGETPTEQQQQQPQETPAPSEEQKEEEKEEPAAPASSADDETPTTTPDEKKDEEQKPAEEEKPENTPAAGNSSSSSAETTPTEENKNNASSSSTEKTPTEENKDDKNNASSDNATTPTQENKGNENQEKKPEENNNDAGQNEGSGQVNDKVEEIQQNASNVVDSGVKMMRGMLLGATNNAGGQAKGGNRNASDPSATIVINGTLPEGASTLYSKDDVTATITITWPDETNLDNISDISVSGMDNASVTPNADKKNIQISMITTEGNEVTFPNSDIKVEYKDDGTDKEIGVGGTAFPVVVDKKAPTVTASFVTTNDASTQQVVSAYTGADIGYDYNLEKDGLYVKVEAQDGIGIDTSSKSKVTWKFEDTSATGTLPSEADVELTKDGNSYVGYAGPFSADSFYVGGKLIIGTVTLQTKDLAGNSASPDPATKDFTSESAALASATLTHSENAPAQIANVDYFKDDVTVTAGIGTDYRNNINSLVVKDDTNDIATLDSGENTVQATVQDEGTHPITATVTTKHNATKTLSDTFAIDKSSPVITSVTTFSDVTASTAISGADKEYNDGSESKPTYTVYDSENIYLKVAFSDACLDMDTTKFYVNETEVSPESWNTTDPVAPYAIVKLSEPESQQEGPLSKLAFKVVAKDKVGNDPTTNGPTDYVLDHTAPVVDITYTKADDSSITPTTVGEVDYCKATQVKVTVMVKDPFFDATNSTITVNGSTSVFPTWTGSQGVYTSTYTFDETAYNVINQLTVTAKDTVDASHQSTTTKKFVVDGTDPVITNVTFNTDAVPLAGQNASSKVDYFDAFSTGSTKQLVATIEVFDVNFDSTATNSKVTVPENTNATWDGTWVAKTGEGNDGKWTTTVTFGKTPVGKTTKFDITAKDKATGTASEKTKYGNWSPSTNKSDDVQLVVDSDTPTVTVSFDKAPVDGKTNIPDEDLVKNVDFFDQSAVIATITVEDNNFDAENTVIDALIDGYAVQEQGWTQASGTSTWTYKVKYLENAAKQNHVLNVNAKDKVNTVKTDIVNHNTEWNYVSGTRKYSGTETAASGAAGFVLDATAPNVVISLSGPGKVFEWEKKIIGFFRDNTKVAPEAKEGRMVISVTDRFINESGLHFAGTEKDETKTDGWRKSDITIEGVPNRVYTLVVPYERDASSNEIYFFDKSATGADLKNFTLWAEDNTGHRAPNDGEYKFDKSFVGDEVADKGTAEDKNGFAVDFESPVFHGLTLTPDQSYHRNIGGVSVPVAAYASSTATFTINVTDVFFNKAASYVTVNKYVDGALASTDTATWKGEKWYRANAEANPNDWSIDVVLNEDSSAGQKNVVYTLDLHAEDMLGNKPYEESRLGGQFIAVDSTQPTIFITVDNNIENTAEGIDYYNSGSVTVTAKAYDASFVADPDTGTGVPFTKTLTASNYEDNNGPKTIADGGEWTWAGDHYEFSHTYTQNNYNTTYDFGGMIGDLLGNGSAHYTYGANAVQASGKPVSGTYFRVDNVAPQISVTMEQPMVGNYDSNDYYASKNAGGKLIATVRVVDRNFDRNTSFIDKSVEVAAADDFVWKGWSSTPTNTFADGSVEWTGTIEYSETIADTHEAFAAWFANTKAEAVYDFALNNTAYNYGANDGNRSTKDVSGALVAGPYFVLDTEIPTVAVRFAPNYAGFVAKTDTDYYDTDSMTATITVTDRNFDDRTDISTIADTRGFGEITAWEHTPGTNTWTATASYKEHAVDTASDLEIHFQDKVKTAANTIGGHNDEWIYKSGARVGASTSGASQFVLDATQPTTRVDINQPKRDDYDGLDYYSDDLTVTITVTDRNFDTDSEIDKKADAAAAHGTNDTGWIQSDNHEVWTRSFSVGETTGIADWADFASADGGFHDLVYTASGNTLGAHTVTYNYRQANGDIAKTYINGALASGTARGFVIDKTAPAMDSITIGFDPSNVGGGIQFFNRATTLYFQFSDACGLETVGLTDPDSIYVINEGTTGFVRGDVRTSSPVTADLRERVEGSRQPSLYERNVELKVTDIVGNYRIWTIDSAGKILFTKTGTEEGAANLPIDGKAGNYPVGLLRDSTAPTVSLDPHSLEGTFSNQTQTVTTTVNEANFDYLQEYRGAEAVVHITKYEGNAGRAMSTREIPATSFGGGAASWSQTEAFAEDGHYIVEAYFSDYANNESNRDRIGEFTIDKTAPVINSIDWSPASGRSYGGRDYFNTARTATITVTEHNWNDALENSFITTNGAIGGWSHNGDTHTCVVTFDHDGDYNLSVKITDKAGNESETRTEPEFTVDLTAPQIRIYNSNATDDNLNEHAYNDVCLPTVSLTDTTTDGQTTFSAADTDIWNVTLVGNNSTNNAKRVTPRTEDASTNSLIVTYADFAHEVEYDDIYTIDVTMTDRAGNPAQILVNDQVVNATTGEARAVFSINRYGSNFIVLNANQYAENEGFLKDRPLVQVQEINVSGSDDSKPAEHHGVTVTRGLDTTILPLQERETPNAEGFYIKNGTNSYSWAVYTYNVYKPNFSNDGDYHVAVSSDDVATNKNISTDYYDPEAKKIADAQVEFTFDGTKPIIDDVNLENGKMYNQAEYPTLTFTATDNYAVSRVEVTIDGETTVVKPDENGTSYAMPIVAKAFTGRDLSIKATDLAGNITEFAINGARITDNIFELYWPFMLFGGAILGVGIYIFIVARKRRQALGA